MTEEQAINVVERCLNSMKERFIMSQTSFTIKIIKKDGIKVLRAPEIPKGGA
jgi:20S proteasome alpha/beta subunit